MENNRILERNELSLLRETATLRILKYGVILLLFWLTSPIAYAQSLYDEAETHIKNREYNSAKAKLRKAIDLYHSRDNSDSVLICYRELQYCYTNTFELDSAKIVLREASNFAQKFAADSLYLDFRMAEAEIYYITGKLDSAKYIFEDVYDETNQFPYFKIRTNFRLASIAHIDLDSTKAYNYIKISLNEALEQRDSSMLGSIYSSYATFESDFGSKKKSISYYIEALPYLQNPRKAMILAGTYRKIAYIFQELDNIPKTKEYINKAYEIASAKSYKREMAYINNLKGEIATEERQYENAINYFKDCLVYFESRKLEDYRLIANVNLVLAYIGQGDLQSAKQTMEHARTLYGNNQVKGYQFQFHYIDGTLAYKLGDARKMYKALQECKKLVTTFDSQRDVLKTLRLERAYYELTNNYSKALEVSNSYHTLKDSLYKVAQSEAIHELEAKYRKSEQDREIQLLSSENALKASILEQQKIIIVGGILALIFLAILSFLSYSLYRKVKHQNDIVSSALEMKDTLLREIHHRVKNNLQIISSLLALQSKYISDKEALYALQQGQDRVQTMALIHQDLYETESLSGVNASNYIHQLSDKLMDSYNYEEEDIQVNVDVDDIVLDLDTMIPLGLIINELISNAFKHAFKEKTDVPKIDVSLKEANGKLILKISDNGRGIKDLSEIEGKSFGFELVRAFAKKLKADMKVKSENGLIVNINIHKYAKLA